MEVRHEWEIYNMISPESIRRYPLFGGLNEAQIVALAMTADQFFADEGEFFFREGDPLNTLYLVE
jgi:hypothetical protein